MSTEQRPEWASGPAWDGWRTDGIDMERSTRSCDFNICQVRSEIAGKYRYSLDGYVQFDTPDAARRVADKIAEELGGWA